MGYTAGDTIKGYHEEPYRGWLTACASVQKTNNLKAVFNYKHPM